MRARVRTAIGGLFALLTLAATLPFLIGCFSSAVRDLAIYRVDVDLLATELLKLRVGSNRTKPDLVHPSLPQYWFFGYSGICDFYTTSARLSASGETRCRHSFPPDQNVLSVVEASMRSAATANASTSETDHEKVVKTVVSAWTEVLDEVPAAKLRDKESKVAAQNKAACALVILAVILDVTTWAVAVCLGAPRTGFLMSCFSAICAVAAGACAVLSMNDGMHGVTSSTGNVSGSLVFLFISALLKFVAVWGLLPRESQSGGTRPWEMQPTETRPWQMAPSLESQPWERPPQETQPWGVRPGEVQPSEPEIHFTEVGKLGESFFNQWCQERIPDYSEQEHWSSRKYSRWEQAKYADFNYQDHHGYMTEELRRAGVQLMPNWGLGTKYHLEVKSTQAECNARPMTIRPSQEEKMILYKDGREAYILVRVFRVGTSQVGVRFFPNPWQLKHDGQLTLGNKNPEGNSPMWINY